MQFSTVASLAAVAAVASAHANVTATTTEHSTTLVTITSCEDHKCEEHVTTAWVSTCTETVNDVVTEYTTWCPISAEEKTAHTASNVTSTAAPHTEKPAEKTTVTQTSTSKAPAAPSSEAPKKTSTVTSTKTSEAPKSTQGVTSYTGAAAKVVPAAGALLAGAAALLL